VKISPGDELLQLHQEAVLADVGVQRIERLHLVELLDGDVRLAQRRHAEVDEGISQRFATEAAGVSGSSVTASVGISTWAANGVPNLCRT
jgi:hypothetical protein